MKLQFDTKAKLAGIGLVPWTRIGLERWFEDYAIASLYGWDLAGVKGAPKAFSLDQSAYGMPELSRLNSQHLIKSDQFQQLLLEQLPGRTFLTYKTLKIPQPLVEGGLRFLGVDKELTGKLENKAAFRELCTDIVPFPAYKSIERAMIGRTAKALELLLAGREAVVLQDEILSGGRGTYVVRTLDELNTALDSIEKLSGGQLIVASDLIPRARERSVQAVVTRYGTFVGPLQKQIIADPLLANLTVPDGDRFCGAEISAEDPVAGVYEEIRAYALGIGKRIQALGYRGIFSVDCLVDESGKVFVLEINPRVTGITPLVTMLYREGQDIPFLLLHTLELAGLDYTIADDSIDASSPEGSLLVLHSPYKYRSKIVDSPSSGLYDLKTHTFLDKRYQLGPASEERQVLIQQFAPGFEARPGGRLMTAYVNGRVLDDQETLLPDVKDALEWLIKATKVEAIP
jgi:hypothetical protein